MNLTDVKRQTQAELSWRGVNNITMNNYVTLDVVADMVAEGGINKSDILYI
jgi:hypothetical protein